MSQKSRPAANVRASARGPLWRSRWVVIAIFAFVLAAPTGARASLMPTLPRLAGLAMARLRR